MTHPQRILATLDSALTSRVELTLYGRAALFLGYEDAPAQYALSLDVDAVMWIGQAEELSETTDFWEAVDKTNAELAGDGLYVSHFFTEDQVALRPTWREHRVALVGDWLHLDLFRLGDLDLLLSKLMRNDPLDFSDAQFIIERAGLTEENVRKAIADVRLPESVEVRDEFRDASAQLLSSLAASNRSE